MQITVEDVSSVKKVLHVEIPDQMVTHELDKAYAQLKKTAKIKGFRPGKVPRNVLERMFKKNVHADVSSRLIQESFLEALKEKDLKVVGTPQLDPPELKAQQAYCYDATVEVKPEIADIDFKGLNLKKPLYATTEAEIEQQLKMLQKRLSQLKPISEPRPLKEGDFALIDYEGFKDGKPYTETQRTENFTLQVGEGKIDKSFDEQLIGMQPDEEREITVSFAADHPQPGLAGNSINFKVKLHEIREEELPPIDDELAKDFGKYETLAELKAEIRSNLQQGYDKRAEQELNEQIFQALIEKTEFELPETMVQYEIEGIIQDAERRFAYQNQTLEDLGLSKEKLATDYRETAEKQVRRQLILSKLIEQEKLELADADLQKGYQEMADALNQPLTEVQNYYRQNAEQLSLFKHALLEKQAITLIMDNSHIEEVAPEPDDSGPADKETASK